MHPMMLTAAAPSTNFSRSCVRVITPELRDVRCSCHQGHVTLFGQLDSFYMKQLAQVIALSVDGVAKVDNQIVVINHDRIRPVSKKSCHG
jgi:osmotically-inducible protein OsmY